MTGRRAWLILAGFIALLDWLCREPHPIDPGTAGGLTLSARRHKRLFSVGWAVLAWHVLAAKRRWVLP